MAMDQLGFFRLALGLGDSLMVPRDHRADEERARQRCSRQVLVQWQSLDTAELIPSQIRRGLAPAGGDGRCSRAWKSAGATTGSVLKTGAAKRRSRR